jgi:hypothetical protein
MSLRSIYKARKMTIKNFASLTADCADVYMAKNLSKIEIEIVNSIRRKIRQGYLNGFREGYAKRKEEEADNERARML